MTKTERQIERQKRRVVGRVSKLTARRGRQEKRRERLERIRKAFSDFEAGRITKTELRRTVPRSWLQWA